jgi:hypothetical protein
MANSKITALTSATTPLAGTEVLPVVQSSTTKQVSVANLTAGRAVTAASLSLTTALPVASGGTGLSSLIAGYIPFGAGTSAFGSSANLFWDSANFRLGVGTSAPTNIIHAAKASTSTTIGGSTAVIKIQNTQSSALDETAGVEFFNRNSSGSDKLAGIYGVYENFNSTGYAGALVFATEAAGGTNVTEGMRLTSLNAVGIGTSFPSASAILDVQSTTRGVRFPNMTTTQKNAISSPAAGLVVFDTTLSKLCVYSGATWQTITSL